MASVKIVLRKKQNKDGTFPLALRLTENRISSYEYIGQNILEKDWDADKECVRKSHPNSVRLNQLLQTKKMDANRIVIEADTENKEMSAQAVKQSLNGSKTVFFFSQAIHYLNDLKLSGNFNQLNSEEPRIKHFKEFIIGRPLEKAEKITDGKDIAFSEITVPLLKTFRAWLEGTRQVKERTVINHYMAVRAVFSQTIKTNPGVEKYYPFGKGKISLKFPESLKVGLSAEEVRRIEELELTAGSPMDHARNVWLTAFYFAGVRVSDVLKLKWADFQDGRLNYTMGKNDKPGSVKISDRAQIVLDRYLPFKDKSGLVFPELRVLPDLNDTFEVQRKTSHADKKFNKHLKKVAAMADISKPLSMHISRHTFGNLSGDKIHPAMLQKLYRHSDIKTTIGYQSAFINKPADDALDAVLNF